MIKNLANAFRKLTLSKKEKLVAGNQLTPSEKQALVVLSMVIGVPLMIAGVIVLIHNVDIINISQY